MVSGVSGAGPSPSTVPKSEPKNEEVKEAQDSAESSGGESTNNDSGGTESEANGGEASSSGEGSTSVADGPDAEASSSTEGAESAASGEGSDAKASGKDSSAVASGNFSDAEAQAVNSHAEAASNYGRALVNMNAENASASVDETSEAGVAIANGKDSQVNIVNSDSSTGMTTTTAVNSEINIVNSTGSRATVDGPDSQTNVTDSNGTDVVTRGNVTANISNADSFDINVEGTPSDVAGQNYTVNFDGTNITVTGLNNENIITQAYNGSDFSYGGNEGDVPGILVNIRGNQAVVPVDPNATATFSAARSTQQDNVSSATTDDSQMNAFTQIQGVGGSGLQSTIQNGTYLEDAVGGVVGANNDLTVGDPRNRREMASVQRDIVARSKDVTNGIQDPNIVTSKTVLNTTGVLRLDALEPTRPDVRSPGEVEQQAVQVLQDNFAQTDTSEGDGVLSAAEITARPKDTRPAVQGAIDRISSNDRTLQFTIQDPDDPPSGNSSVWYGLTMNDLNEIQRRLQGNESLDAIIADIRNKTGEDFGVDDISEQRLNELVDAERARRATR